MAKLHQNVYYIDMRYDKAVALNNDLQRRVRIKLETFAEAECITFANLEYDILPDKKTKNTKTTTGNCVVFMNSRNAESACAMLKLAFKDNDVIFEVERILLTHDVSEVIFGGS